MDLRTSYYLVIKLTLLYFFNLVFELTLRNKQKIFFKLKTEVTVVCTFEFLTSMALLVQTRRRKLDFLLNFRNSINWSSPFPLDIHNAINWAGAFSKAFSSSEALISVLSKNACLHDNISNSFQSKTLYIELIFKWSHLDTNLWICKFVHPSKNMLTEHQLLVTVLAYRKYHRRWFKYPPCTSQWNNICITELL